VAVGLAVPAGAIDPGRTEEPEGSGPRSTERLASLESQRYRYWDVALDVFAEHPLKGVGAGGFRVEWAREGARWGAARDAHSLYVETAAELGIVGLAFLGMLAAGLLGSARRALAHDAAATVGPAAMAFTWAFHAGIDWDWEVPAVTLPALVAAGLLVALGDGEDRA
jgi:O-antigen ligase